MSAFVPVIILTIIYISDAALTPITNRNDYTTTLQSAEEDWGSWGGMKYCDEGQWVKTYVQHTNFRYVSYIFPYIKTY